MKKYEVLLSWRTKFPIFTNLLMLWLSMVSKCLILNFEISLIRMNVLNFATFRHSLNCLMNFSVLCLCEILACYADNFCTSSYCSI